MKKQFKNSQITKIDELRSIGVIKHLAVGQFEGEGYVLTEQGVVYIFDTLQELKFIADAIYERMLDQESN